MKSYIKIDLDSERFDFMDKYEIDCEICDSDKIIGIKILTDLDEPFDNLFSDCDITKMADEYNEFRLNYNGHLNEKDYIKDENILEIVDNYDYISFAGELPVISEYIKKNNLEERNICLSDCLDFSQQTYEDIIKYFGNKTNIYLSISGNTNYISLQDFKKSLDIINGYVNFIKALKLSPVEEIMCAYDIVKNKMYCEENENEANELSRDLCSVLLGDKIVCLGFSRIFNEILLHLGRKSIICMYDDEKNPNGGHARNFTYIKDDKYDIDGAYYFDVTWDSKKENDEDFYINRYRFFLKTLNEIETLTPNYLINSSFDAKIFNDDVLENINVIGRKEIKTLNTLSNLFEGKELVDSDRIYHRYMKNIMDGISNEEIFNEDEKDRVKQFISKYKDKFNKRIDLKTFLKILYNVRKKEYYYNMTEKLDKENLIRSMLNSNFTTREFLLLAAIFDYNKEQQQRKLINDSNEMIMKNKLDLGIKRVELTKTLKKVLEKKIND